MDYTQAIVKERPLIPKEKPVYNLIAILLIVVGAYMTIDGLAKRK